MMLNPLHCRKMLMMRVTRLVVACSACLATAASALIAAASETAPAVGASGLALPRYASLKVDRINLRQGPGTDYPTAWVLHRAGMPVEVIKEFEGWRQIRDVEGTTGWVQGSMLSGRRTVLVRNAAPPPPAGQSQSIVLRADARDAAQPAAYLEAGVMAGVIGCDGRWCRLSIGDVRGYIEQTRLWGVYSGEVVK